MTTDNSNPVSTNGIGKPARRTAGVLLHVTSLPGPFGIGDIGPAACRFVDWAAGAGLRLWQILPINPPGAGNSPYATFSSFAGSPLSISPERLVEEGFVRDVDAAEPPPFDATEVEYPKVRAWKKRLLEEAFRRFQREGTSAQKSEFDEFCRDPAQAAWLDDFCIFAAVKAKCSTAAWPQWPRPLATRDPQALAEWEAKHSDEVQYHRFVQFLFYRQWRVFKAYAAKKGIRLIGDLPIYVSHDSADVWANQGLFKLDKAGQPTVVAGVPPDYFSRTGQLWGNPIYRWDVHEQTGYAWWRERLRAAFRTVDLVRLDHFRGFAAYWEVPAGKKTARKGRWVKGPGAALFEAAHDVVREDGLIAEDLGVITPDVEALRDRLGLPGMHVLQFAFAPSAKRPRVPDLSNPNVPYNHRQNAVVYTGTHDNDTTRGWYQNATETERHLARAYLSVDGGLIHWDMVRCAFSSVARRAIVPVQDILGLGSEARMNTPGVPTGNWTWRIQADALTGRAQKAVADLARFYGRCGVEKEARRTLSASSTNTDAAHSGHECSA